MNKQDPPGPAGRCEICAAAPLDAPVGKALRDSANALADTVRASIPHSPRPVFLHYVAETFETLAHLLSRNLHPHPTTPAAQLCLHLLIAHAEHHAPDDKASAHPHSEEFSRLRTVFLPAHGSEAPLSAGRFSRTHPSFDFIALGSAMTDNAMSTFFAPLEPRDPAA